MAVVPQHPAVAVLVLEVAHRLRRIERDRQITLVVTPRIYYLVLLDVIARREKSGVTEDNATVREAFRELVTLGTT